MAPEMWIGIIIFVIVVVGVFFLLYKRIGAIFAGFYHNKASHLIILTQNSQHAIEWRIWSYFFWNRMIGKKKGVLTCIDTGSTDDTLKILRRLSTRYDRLNIVKLHPTITLDEAIQQALAEHGQSEKMIVLDLQEPEERQEKNSA